MTTERKEMTMYQEMFNSFQRGEITSEQWYAFCMTILEKILVENKEIFVRLKNA